MKELLTIASNNHVSFAENNKPLPRIELIFVASEPAYSVDACGEVVRHRETTSTRFMASPTSLRKMAALMMQLADEAEALVASLIPPPKS